MSDHDLLIVGAGVSGLSMAHYAAGAGLKTLVLERDSRPGGCLHSHRFGGPLDGFWLELGAHSAFNSYGNLLAILESVGAWKQLRPRAKVGFRLFADGAARAIPSQLYIPELLLAPLRLWGRQKTGRTVAEYYGPLVGRRNYARVFEPAFNAVLCQAAGAFPAASLFRSRPRRKDAPHGFTLPNGLQTIADLLARQSGVAVAFGRTVRAIRREGDRFIVHSDEGDYTARALCLATPVAAAAELARPAFPAIAEALADIASATVESVGVALPSERVRLPNVAGLIGRDEAFYSVVSRDTAPDPRYRGFTFHFRPALLDREEQLARIAQVLDAPRSAFGSDNVAFKRNILPVLRVGHEERIQRLDGALAGTRLALTGNYFTGVAIEDCVTRSLEEWRRLRREGG